MSEQETTPAAVPDEPLTERETKRAAELAFQMVDKLLTWADHRRRQGPVADPVALAETQAKQKAEDRELRRKRLDLPVSPRRLADKIGVLHDDVVLIQEHLKEAAHDLELLDDDIAVLLRWLRFVKRRADREEQK